MPSKQILIRPIFGVHFRETEKQKNKEKEDPGKQYGREMKKG